MAKEKIEKQEQTTPEQQLETYLKNNKEDHYNFEEIKTHVISSGSLILDTAMSSGLRTGTVFRASGVTSGGKTSCSLSFMKNFLETVPNSRGILIKSEGRLSHEVAERSGVVLTEDYTAWKDGTCFIYKTNIYESAISLIRNLVKSNSSKKVYFFLIDSMDSLCPRGDIDRPFEEAGKVAGAALLTSDFLRKMALAFTSMGHVCMMISQVRSTIKINPYEKTAPQITNASGGSAALHYSDWILEFQPRFNKDIIWEGEEGKSKRLGHFCKVVFRKSVNEKDGVECKYPIIYGRTRGTSIWTEMEILDMIKMWQLVEVTARGGWLTFQQTFIDEIKKECNFDLPEKIQGDTAFLKILEENKGITKYLVEKFKKLTTQD